MISKEYIEELKSRALLLGIDNDYIDSDEVFMLMDSHLVLNLTKYISLEDKEIYYIPDGIWGLFIKDCNFFTTLKNKITIVTNGDLSSVSDILSFVSNSINILGKLDLSKVTLDLRLSKYINNIDTHTFSNAVIDKLYFGSGLVNISSYSFTNCNINEVSFENLKTVGSYAFRDANIKKLDLGKNIVKISSGSFLFDSPVEECILLDSEGLENDSFKNIKNIYIPFDLYEKNIDVADDLSNYIRDLRDEKMSIYEFIDKINIYVDEELNTYIREKGKKSLIEKEYLKYLNSNSNDDMDLLKESLDSLFVKSSVKSSVYLYNSKYYMSKYDIYERDYELLFSTEYADYYIEN